MEAPEAAIVLASSVRSTARPSTSPWARTRRCGRRIRTPVESRLRPARRPVRRRPRAQRGAHEGLQPRRARTVGGVRGRDADPPGGGGRGRRTGRARAEDRQPALEARLHGRARRRTRLRRGDRAPARGLQRLQRPIGQRRGAGGCAARLRVAIRHEIDPARVRRHDVPDIRGTARRLEVATGWKPRIPLEQTIADALEAWRGRLAIA